MDDRARDARDRRDRQATAEHDQRVAAGERRILARAADGRLVSYRPEDYGFTKTGTSHTIKTVWGMGLLALFSAGFGIWMTAAFVQGVLAGDDVPWGVWFVPPIFAVLCAAALLYLRVECRARRLRRERGLPRPVS